MALPRQAVIAGDSFYLQFLFAVGPWGELNGPVHGRHSGALPGSWGWKQLHEQTIGFQTQLSP